MRSTPDDGIFGRKDMNFVLGLSRYETLRLDDGKSGIELLIWSSVVLL